MSGWVILYILVTLGVAGLIGMKLIPVYMDSFKVDKSMKAVIEDTSTTKQNKREILEALIKRLDIDSVDAIHYRNYKNIIKVTKKGDKVTIVATYRVDTPLFSNLLLVLDFNKKVSN
jgi:hypothetical protein